MPLSPLPSKDHAPLAKHLQVIVRWYTEVTYTPVWSQLEKSYVWSSKTTKICLWMSKILKFSNFEILKFSSIPKLLLAQRASEVGRFFFIPAISWWCILFWHTKQIIVELQVATSMSFFTLHTQGKDDGQHYFTWDFVFNMTYYIQAASQFGKSHPNGYRFNVSGPICAGSAFWRRSASFKF